MFSLLWPAWQPGDLAKQQGGKLNQPFFLAAGARALELLTSWLKTLFWRIQECLNATSTSASWPE
jgi:hypothetical protein